MNLLRSHWFWLFTILTLVSGWDYWDHISRSGSVFEQAPGAWFAFTFASHLTLFGFAWGLSKLLDRLPIPELLAGTMGIGAAAAAHLLVTGPLWDRVFWDGGLMFDAIAAPVAVACGAYLLYRGAFRIVSTMWK